MDKVSGKNGKLRTHSVPRLIKSLGTRTTQQKSRVALDCLLFLCTQDFILETEEDEAFLEGISSKFDYDDILTMVGLWWIWNLYLVDKIPKNLFSKYIKKGIRHGIREGIRNSLKAVSGSGSYGYGREGEAEDGVQSRELPLSEEEGWQRLEAIADWLDEAIEEEVRSGKLKLE